MYVGRTFWTINASCQEGVIGKAVFGASVPRATQSSKDSKAFPGRCIESASGGLMDAFYAQLLRLAKVWSRRTSSCLPSFVTARCANKSWRKHASSRGSRKLRLWFTSLRMIDSMFVPVQDRVFRS